MKKVSYALIGFILISIILCGPTVSVQGTTYNCTGVVGADATWKVKTVHSGALNDIFGVGWVGVIQNSFGYGAEFLGAKMKSVVTYVNASYQYDPGNGLFDACIILADVWLWTTSPFADVPDFNNVGTIIFMHPENLTAYCQYVGSVVPAFEGNVSMRNAFPYLNGIPVPAEDYLAELLWDNDYLIQDTTVTHNVAASYQGLNGAYLVACTETWRYSKSYGTFLGYELVHNNGTTAYETELVTPSAEEIPGFNLFILAGISLSAITCIIYVIMKRK